MLRLPDNACSASVGLAVASRMTRWLAHGTNTTAPAPRAAQSRPSSLLLQEEEGGVSGTGRRQVAVALGAGRGRFCCASAAN